MITRMDSDDGKSSMIAIYPDESISVFKDKYGINIIEGTNEHLRELYECLKDLFEEEDEEAEGK